MNGSQFENLMRLLNLVGGKFVIVEDGEPKAVLLSYQEFEKLVIPSAVARLTEAASRIEKINEMVTHAQLLDLREEVIQEDPDQITIEPLD